MKVLLIDVTCKQGSTGKIVYDLYTQINSNGNEAAICYGRGKKIKENNIFKFGFDVETYFHAFLTRITGFTGCFSYFSTKRLIHFIKKFKPDVVNIHELHAYFLNVNMLLNFLKKQDIKVVHTLHCAFSYTGKCGHHLECDGWKKNCGNCPRKKEYISTLFFDHTKTMFLRKKKAFLGFNNMEIICPSNWLANYAKQSFLGVYNVGVIHNGIDLSVFYPRDTTKLREKLEIDINKKIVLSVAPKLMSNAKGGKWVLELAKILKNENIIFILVGVEDVNMVHGDNVLLFNKTSDQNELAHFYSLADLFVICSEMENFPTTCVESQCCGTPVCGFDVGGAKETDIISKNNFVEYGDTSSLSKVIISLLSKNKPAFLAEKASKIYSKDKMFYEYNKLYNKWK